MNNKYMKSDAEAKVNAIAAVLVILSLLGFSWSPLFIVLSAVAVGLYFKINAVRVVAVICIIMLIPWASIMLLVVLFTLLGLVNANLLYGSQLYSHTFISFMLLLSFMSLCVFLIYSLLTLRSEEIKELFDS